MPQTHRPFVSRIWFAALPLTLALSLAPRCSPAGEEFDYEHAFPSQPHRDPDELYQTGRFETSVVGGALFSPHRNEDIRRFDYSWFSARFGMMLTTPHGRAWWRGNTELGVEAFGGNFIVGNGSYLIGSQAWVRYNFVPHQSRWTPFGQAGCGGLFTDATPEAVGRRFNFVSSLGFGLRCHLGEHWALSLEYRYQHVSNGGTASPNLGFNAQGGLLGISRFF